MSNWQFDTAKTQERYDRLQEYYQRTGLNADNFFCQQYGACSGSQKDGTVKQYSGGTAGLSPFFDVSYAGQPIRILIIGKETAYQPDNKFGTASNFDTRSKQCVSTIYAKKRTFHIKGTLLTLQRIFEVESDYAYATYALSNALRCGFQRAEIAENTSSLTDTKIMRTNCAPYLIDEIEILEPTLIITQGAWAVDSKPSLVERFGEALDIQPQCLMENQENGKYGLYEFGKFMMITSHHPARIGLWKTRYAPDSLWPMIDHLKEIGYLPKISSEDTQIFEKLIKPTVDVSVS